MLSPLAVVQTGRRGAALAVCLWLGASSTVDAQVLFEHRGANNPTTEAWTQGGPLVTGISAGPVINDLGTTGLNAWFVDDDSIVVGSFIQYERALTSGQIAIANTMGWTLRARLRVVDVPDSVDYSVYAAYQAGASAYYLMGFGSDADGNPIVRLGYPGGSEFTVQGSGYHLYELVFDPLAGTADLFVDGTEVISNYAGSTATGFYLVGWGGGDSGATGHGNYNLVQFEVHPLPVTIDIKPGSFPNSINPGSPGVLPVAIITTPTFEANGVVPATVRFGLTGTEATPQHWALQDVDGDGDIDMILHFATGSSGIPCGATSAMLTGWTSGNQAVKGVDSVRTVGCK